jgi:hypothetical protein
MLEEWMGLNAVDGLCVLLAFYCLGLLQGLIIAGRGSKNFRD